MNVTLNITTDSLDEAIATLSAIKAGLGFDPDADARRAEYEAARDAELAQGDCPQIAPVTQAEHTPIRAEGEAEATPPPPAPAEAADDDAELDERGMPWDARIHASTKSRLANGNWKNKRGVDAAELAAIEAELLSTNAAAEPDPAIDNSAPTPPPPAPAAEPPHAATPPPPVAETAGAETVETFPQLMHYIQSKGLTPEQYVPMLQAFNLAALPDLLKPENAGVIPQLHAALAGA